MANIQLDKLVIASNNKKKRAEIEAILSNLGIEVVPAEQTIFVDVVEDAGSFAGNAKKKADAFKAANGCAALADDSGLCVTALNNAPGVYSARFAGEHASDSDNNSKLLHDLQGLKDRTAYFICALHLSLPDGSKITAEGRVEGLILEAQTGDTGFGYDPLFFCPELDKTFAQSSPQEKAAISHRGRALRALHNQLLD
ncbi:MAG: non-canonical purine NTP pyrophosphatase, RdgB/HAM1 family [Zetaproteobacteria bacterium]|nr:MAG: non-canonical purine NTP pyrophosphatase, RdgB/HAM1 family [Zetaproteobacteria bacterium]